MNKIGPNIRTFREANDWTQDQLAARCHLIGWDISRSTLAKIESQSRRLIDEEIVLLADALGVTIQQLFDGS